MLDDEWDPGPTEIEPFPRGAAAVEVRSSDETKRRCAGCGAELPADAAAYRRGALRILNAFYAAMVRGGNPIQVAADKVQEIADAEGVLLL